MQFFVCFSFYFYFYSSRPSEIGLGKIRETTHKLSVSLHIAHKCLLLWISQYCLESQTTLYLTRDGWVY